MTASLIVRQHRPEIPVGDSHYHALIRASDGRVYFALSSHQADRHAQLMVFDPVAQRVRPVVDFGRALGENGLGAIAQGKIHVKPVELDGWLYGATHVGYYDRSRGRALPGRVSGRAPYPGGHFFAYRLETGEVRSLGRARGGEGILAMAMDPRRRRLFGLTWPSGRLLQHELGTPGVVVDHGPGCGDAETGQGELEQVCRAMVVDPRDGRVYWSRENGTIMMFDPERGHLTSTGCRLTSRIGGDAWRGVLWHPGHQAFWGTLARTATVFRFDPKASSVQSWDPPVPQDGPVDRVGRPAARASQGLVLSPGQDRLYTLVRFWSRGRLLRNWWSRVHLLSVDPADGRIVDHGPLRCPDGRHVENADSLELGVACLYAVGRLGPPLWERILHRLEQARGRDPDAYPGRNGLVELPVPTA